MSFVRDQQWLRLLSPHKLLVGCRPNLAKMNPYIVLFDNCSDGSSQLQNWIIGAKEDSWIKIP